MARDGGHTTQAHIDCLLVEHRKLQEKVFKNIHQKIEYTLEQYPRDPVVEFRNPDTFRELNSYDVPLLGSLQARLKCEVVYDSTSVSWYK